MSEDDAAFMREALQQAVLAAQAGEVPVGAVVVRQGRIVGRGHNRSVGARDITAHAEVQALRQASAALGNHRLDGCTLYVTLEPCIMCSGAIMGARLARLVYGASEPKTGAAGSVVDLFSDARLNHHTRVQGGLMAADCGALLQGFFQDRRQAQHQERSRSFLREDALRCDASRVPAWPVGVRSDFSHELPSLEGLRLHLLAAGEGGTAVLALHGTDSWSAVHAQAGPVLASAGLALVAPDLPGFGLSDKPKKASWHVVQTHAAVLRELIERLPQSRVLLAAPTEMQALLGWADAHPKVAAVFSVDPAPLSEELRTAAYPDAGHRVGPPALAMRLKTQPSAPVRVHLGADWAPALAAMGY